MRYFSDQTNILKKNKHIFNIGAGSLGGKAQGLSIIQDVLEKNFKKTEFPNIEVEIPNLATICTDVFDAFMENNNLYEVANSDLPDDRIAHAFQKADLPFETLGFLRSLVSWHNTPLAVRSSSLLEDALYIPFAGVYGTKMTPNNQLSIDERFNKLVEAIKFVYASTFFKSAKDYIQATKHDSQDEKMAVSIQEVIGKQFGRRFYPELSGVARSYNYYPMGQAKAEDGIISLALGLGKTIVDGGITWAYSPRYPKVDPPYRTVRELLKQSQTEFWAVNMGDPPDYDPIHETEYLLLENLIVAEKDQSLRFLASTYNPYSDRLVPGMMTEGARVLTFAPLLVLEELPLNNLIIRLLKICETALNGPVEIEFAMTFNPNRFGFLQVRPMVVFSDEVEIYDDELKDDNVLIASDTALGNGVLNSIQDIVYVNPNNFNFKNSRAIVPELARMNRNLLREQRPYLLVVFGRLGTTDPWLGIPANWGHVSGAKVVVEAAPENANLELSQGSHFFHNIISLGIKYFTVPHSGNYPIDWQWMEKQKIVDETQHLCHVRLPTPLLVRVDGRCGRGVVYKL